MNGARTIKPNKEYSSKPIRLLKMAQVIAFLLLFVGGIILGMVMTSHMNQDFVSERLFSYSSLHYGAPMNTGNGSSNCTLVEVCKNEDCLSVESFIRPKNLIHGMSDDELFWRASMVPQKYEFPYERVPKVAFMFLTRGPLPFLPLWEKFFKGKDNHKFFSIYVHSFPGYDLNISKTSAFYGRQIPSKRVKWGSIGLIDAEKRLLANALLDFSNERFVLLSESCIPVYNFQTVYKYLINSEHSFVGSYDDPSRYGRGRYSRNMSPHIKLSQWRKGSQWFEMSRAVAIYAVSDVKYYSLFRDYCRPACYPDEHYFPTFLNMFHGSLTANRSVTWVDWSLGGPHPATFGEANVTEDFIQSIRNNGTRCTYNSELTSVCYLFARKFAPSALEPLLNLTSTVMEF